MGVATRRRACRGVRTQGWVRVRVRVRVRGGGRGRGRGSDEAAVTVQ